MLASYGTRGYRIRQRGGSWRAVTESEWAHTVPAQTRRLMDRLRKAVWRGRPRACRTGMRVYYEHVSAEIVGEDTVRIWCDIYIEYPMSMVHGRMRVSGVQADAEHAVITRWFKPRGQSWLPMFCRPDDGLLEELGFIDDFEQDEVTDVSQDDTR